MAGMRSLLPLVIALAWTGCVKPAVHGRITDCRGTSPIEGVDVQLTSQTPDVAWDAVQTGSDGAYAFAVGDAARAMPVTLTAAKRGFQTVQRTYSSMPSGDDAICMQPTTR
jgi:hypothetical protein